MTNYALRLLVTDTYLASLNIRFGSGAFALKFSLALGSIVVCISINDGEAGGRSLPNLPLAPVACRLGFLPIFADWGEPGGQYGI